jgi:hypothetical protein
MYGLSVLILIILILAGIFGFFIIRDFLFLINYFAEQREIEIYNKKYRRYQKDKKKLLDKRLEHERELKKEHGLDYVQEPDQQIIGFIAPQGKHSESEFRRNYAKYSRIAKAAKEGKSLYWSTMIKLAKSSGKEQARGR